eukprot:scaffold5469_cov54-Attheya_sp.AAC.5
MASCPSILRIGPTDSTNLSAVLLRDALTSHFKVPSRSDSWEDTQSLTVVNKYFSAEISLHSLSLDRGNDVEGKEDGVLLVFDSVSAFSSVQGSMIGSFNPFDALTTVHDEAETAGRCGDLLRLCVGVTLSASDSEHVRTKEYEEEYSRRVLWCLDRGYEYVEADLSEEGRSTGHDERDKDGFARIAEALVGTMWSSAVMGSDASKKLKNKFVQSIETQMPAEEHVTSEATIQANPANPKPDSPIVQPQEKSSTDAGSGESKLNDLKVESLILGDKEENQPLKEDHLQEKQFDNLDNLLGEAAKIRDQARTGTISDEDRRKRAGDAASMLMGLLDTMGFDESDDEDIVDSSDDEEK